MARVPCSFSAQEDFVARIDARAAELHMKRSEYIVHALRLELMGAGRGMTILAEQPDSQGGGRERTQSHVEDGSVKKYPGSRRKKK